MNRRSIWVTRTGQMVRVGSMEDDHLVNTIHFLQRYHEAQCWYAVQLPEPRGIHAQDAWDQELSALFDAGPEYSVPIYSAMVEEAEDRGLKFKSHYYDERLVSSGVYEKESDPNSP
jgi:hypothetical protein